MVNVRRSRVFAAASNWPIINGSLIDNRTLFTPTAKFVIRTSKQILLLLQFLKIWPVFDTKLQWELTLLFAKNRMIRTCALIGSLCYLSTTTPLVSLELYRKNPLQLRPFSGSQAYCLHYTNSLRTTEQTLFENVPIVCLLLTFECLNTFCTHYAKTQCKQNIVST